MTRFTYPPKPCPGDAVAIVSPSSRLVSRFPEPLELGLARLRSELELGHTEPQHIIPSGGEITVNAIDRLVEVTH